MRARARAHADVLAVARARAGRPRHPHCRSAGASLPPLRYPAAAPRRLRLPCAGLPHDYVRSTVLRLAVGNGLPREMIAVLIETLPAPAAAAQ